MAVSPSSRQSFVPPEEVNLMVESRWLRWVGPGLVALGAVALIASTTVGAGVRAWIPRPCVGPASDLAAAAREAIPADISHLTATPWYRLDPIVGADGALESQRLVLGRFGDPVTRSLDLAAESFAAGPFGHVVLVGSDDGTASRLTAIDVDAGCSWALAVERDVIRRATIDPTGTDIYEMRVDRATRADLGIWHRRMGSNAPVDRILAPIPPDPRFGRTFSTEFTWDLAGDRLVVQSCGEVACRTRLLDPRGGATVTLDAPDLGLLVGIDGDRVVTYATCRGLPCPIVSSDIATGERRILASAAGFAAVVRGPDGPSLVHETRPVTGAPIRVVPLDGRPSSDQAPGPDNERLIDPLAPWSATRLPADWVLFAPDGRLPDDPSDRRLHLRHVPDGTVVPLEEALR